MLNVANEVDWDGFEAWLRGNHAMAHARRIRNYARKYGSVLFNPIEASALVGFTRGKRVDVMCALANLSKYLGMYGRWREIVSQTGLKWEKRPQIEVFLSMINTDLAGVKDWLRRAIERLPERHSSVLIFDAATGLRPEEACRSSGLMTQLIDAGRLNEYFDAKFSMLMHFRYPSLFLRKSKNCYISFLPDDVLQLIQRVKPQITIHALRRQIQYIRLPNRIMDLRKLYATTLRESGISQEAIDLLQGRISQSIFLRHYYRPQMLTEIREKALRAIQQLIKETA